MRGRLFFLVFTSVFITSLALAGQKTFKAHITPAPPGISATVKFSEPSGNNILDAEETGKLTITVKNEGPGDAFDVTAKIQADKNVKGLSYEKSVSIGTIPAGKTATGRVDLRASEDLSTEKVSFTVSVTEANGFDADPMKIAFGLKAFEPPKLVVADIGIDDHNENSKVEPLENVEITVRVQNMGHGDARGVSVDIQNGENVFMGGDGKTGFEIGSLRAGEFRDIKFMFYTNKRIGNGQEIPITVRMSEERPKFNTEKALGLVMNAKQKSVDEIVVKGIETPKKGEIEIAGGLSIDVDMNVPHGMKAGKDDVAVVIGNKHYTAEGVPDVEYADRDARMVKEYLITTFGFDTRNIIYEEDAGLSKFQEIFGTASHPEKSKLYGWVKKDISSVFIYYVGHGAPDLDSQEAYFVPSDANPQFISANGYSLQTFYGNISKLPAKEITVVLDSCFSGNSDKGMLFKGISPAMVKVKKSYMEPSNAVLITSAAMDEVSSWYAEKKHSLFTYYFLKGLQGEADADNDRKITIGEMKSYLKENVSYMAQRLSNVTQSPVVTGNADAVIVRLK